MGLFEYTVPQEESCHVEDYLNDFDCRASSNYRSNDGS